MCYLLCQEDNKRQKKLVTINKNKVLSENKGVRIHFGFVR